jgi:hypothetical protein
MQSTSLICHYRSMSRYHLADSSCSGLLLSLVHRRLITVEIPCLSTSAVLYNDLIFYVLYMLTSTQSNREHSIANETDDMHVRFARPVVCHCGFDYALLIFGYSLDLTRFVCKVFEYLGYVICYRPELQQPFRCVVLGLIGLSALR